MTIALVIIYIVGVFLLGGIGRALFDWEDFDGIIVGILWPALLAVAPVAFVFFALSQVQGLLAQLVGRIGAEHRPEPAAELPKATAKPRAGDGAKGGV